MEHLESSLIEAIFLLLQVAVKGGLLVWGAFMGRFFALVVTKFFLSRIKPTAQLRPINIAIISMPIMVLIAIFFAFYGFKFVVNPGETRIEAFQDAKLTFFLVLLPLLAGCIWGMINSVSRE